jgi:hypothetical protein
MMYRTHVSLPVLRIATPAMTKSPAVNTMRKRSSDAAVAMDGTWTTVPVAARIDAEMSKENKAYKPPFTLSTESEHAK